MIYFLVYLFLEEMISGSVFGRLGYMGTLLEIISNALVGFIILTNIRITLGESFVALQRGSISSEEFQRLNIFTIIGAVLLIIPGAFSDIIGVGLQFGFITTLLANRMGGGRDVYKHHQKFHDSKRREDDEIIDVEVIDHIDKH